MNAKMENSAISVDLWVNEELFQFSATADVAKQLIDAGYATSMTGVQRVQIPTSPEVAEKIKNLSRDKTLWPVNMTFVSSTPLEQGLVMVEIDWKRGKLSDLFFLGYWSNFKPQL